MDQINKECKKLEKRLREIIKLKKDQQQGKKMEQNQLAKLASQRDDQVCHFLISVASKT
jgi:hypothetical protein